VTDRNPIPDFAKGIAVLCMIQVHIIELLARPDILNSVCGKTSLFFGGPPAAPVFMVVMGYYAISSRKTLFPQILRGMGLLVLGLALNIALNLNALFHIFFHNLDKNPLPFIFGADILFLAGFSIIIISLIKPLFKKNYLFYFIFALIVALIPLFTKGFSLTGCYSYPAAYIFSEAPWSYFPLIPWLAYPLMGSGSYFLFQQQWFIGLSKKIKILMLLLCLIILLSTSVWAFSSITSLPLYYHHNILLFLWICLFLMIWFFIMEKTILCVRRNWVIQYIIYTGKNVTAFYVIQWILIGNTATASYKNKNALSVSIFMISTLIITSLLVYGFNKYKQYRTKDMVL